MAMFFQFLYVPIDWVGVKVYNLAKKKNKEWGQYSAILTEQPWSVKDLSYGFSFSLGNIFLPDTAHNSKQAR